MRTSVNSFTLQYQLLRVRNQRTARALESIQDH